MLKKTIPGGEFYDEENCKFITVPETHLQLEHSLLSISRWESKWKRSFFVDGPKTMEERMDYIQAMTITQNVNPYVYKIMPASIIKQIETYASLNLTATKVYRKVKPTGKKITPTSELIYYWMIEFGIPFECDKWHFSRLWALLDVCSVQNNPKKETKAEAAARTRNLNAIRRAKH